MQRSPPAVLAGGHEKHFNFLPGGQLVSKTSGLREVYFYLWICQITGKTVFHTSSEAAFLAELNSCKKPSVPPLISPDNPPRASDVQEYTGAGPQACPCTSRLSLSTPETVDSVDKETESGTVYPLESVPVQGLGTDAASLEKVDPPMCDSVKSADASHQGQRFYIVGQEGCCCGKGPNEQRLTACLSLRPPSDETFLRNLIIPDTSTAADDFRKFSKEYHRQARAVAPWLPLCLGAIEHAHVSSSSTGVSEALPREANCPPGTTATKCATSSASPARPKGEVVMENLLYGMSKPAVMDTKLGTKYYGEVVSPAKREKEARYAQQRGTHEVGMAFGGYCCGSPFDKNVLSVSGGSRAPENFSHPKTVEAFSYWFQSFLMLQGDVDIAIELGRTFARLVSGLIDVRRSMQERPLVDFFGTSVLLIYDAAAHTVVNSARSEDLAGGMEEAKGCAKQREGKVVGAREQTAAAEIKDTLVIEQRGLDEKDEKLIQLSKNAREADPELRHHLRGRDNDGGCVDKGISGDSSVRDGTAGQCEKTAGHPNAWNDAYVTDLQRSAQPVLNAKVRIVDFAHVVILPRQVDKGFIFGLENLRAALRLATSSLENTKRGQLPATQ